MKGAGSGVIEGGDGTIAAGADDPVSRRLAELEKDSSTIEIRTGKIMETAFKILSHQAGDAQRIQYTNWCAKVLQRNAAAAAASESSDDSMGVDGGSVAHGALYETSLALELLRQITETFHHDGVPRNHLSRSQFINNVLHREHRVLSELPVDLERIVGRATKEWAVIQGSKSGSAGLPGSSAGAASDKAARMVMELYVDGVRRRLDLYVHQAPFADPQRCSHSTPSS